MHFVSNSRLFGAGSRLQALLFGHDDAGDVNDQMSAALQVVLGHGPFARLSIQQKLFVVTILAAHKESVHLVRGQDAKRAPNLAYKLAERAVSRKREAEDAGLVLLGRGALNVDEPLLQLHKRRQTDLHRLKIN